MGIGMRVQGLELILQLIEINNFYSLYFLSHLASFVKNKRQFYGAPQLPWKIAT
jgi:hypothetical protein